MEYAEIYLDLLSGGVEGNAEASGYEKMIEIYDWAWGMALEEASATGTGGSGEKQTVGKGISISKHVDGATTSMLRKLEDGTRIPTASLILVDRGEVGLMVRFDFKQVLLMSYDLEVDGDDDQVELTESWTFNYEEVAIQYKPRPKAGKTTAAGTQKFILRNEWSGKFDAVAVEDKKSATVKGDISKMSEKELSKLVSQLVAEQLSKIKK
jgi:type VI secretion system secreted protein Hcp